MIKRKGIMKPHVSKAAKASKALKKKSTGKTTKTFDFTLNTIIDYIRTRAYYIWEDLGKPQGKDNDVWNKAEKDILSKIIKKH